MAKRLMPRADQERPAGVNLQWDLTPRALERWTPTIVARGDAPQAAGSAGGTISIYEPIGEDLWTGEGMTAKRVAAILRTIGEDKPVRVDLNSPGGDMFEGLAIYNVLRQHEGEVTVRVLGLAASAASVVAMAGDRIEVARAGFFMVHNAWMMAVGNRNDLRQIADTLEPFDRAMASIYAARTGASGEAMMLLMDNESWIAGESAIEQGFADALLPADQITEQPEEQGSAAAAARVLERALASAGLPRSQRRAMMQAYKAGSTPSAAPPTRTPSAAPEPSDATRDAGNEVMSAFAAFQINLAFAATRASL